MEEKLQPFLEIGKIVNTYGIKGALKVIPLTNSSERYFDLEWAFVGNENDKLKKYTFENVKLNKGIVIVKFKEISNINEAEHLKNSFIKVDRENAVKLPEDAFFVCDLIGCHVIDESTDESLGVIKDIIETGSNDVYIVKNNDSSEILIPALKSVVRKVSLEQGKIWVLLPPGL